MRFIARYSSRSARTNAADSWSMVDGAGPMFSRGGLGGTLSGWAVAQDTISSPQAASRKPLAMSVSELLLEESVEDAGVSLAFQLPHRLADEEAEQVLLAGLVLLDLAGAARQHGIDDLFERAFVRDLGEALRLDDGLGRLAGPQRLAEDFLGGGGRDRAGVLQREEIGEPARREAGSDRALFQSAGDLVDDRLRGARAGDARLAVDAQQLDAVGERARVSGGDPRVGQLLEHLVRQLRHLDLVDEILRNRQRRQVRLREVPVIIRFFL